LYTTLNNKKIKRTAHEKKYNTVKLYISAVWITMNSNKEHQGSTNERILKSRNKLEAEAEEIHDKTAKGIRKK